MSRTGSGPLAPLLIADFRYLLIGAAISHMMMPLQFVTQILWVQNFAPRDIWLILVALIATCRGLGAIIFGLYGGALADRFDRRSLLMVVQSLQVVGTLGIAAMMLTSFSETISFAIFFLLIFLTSGLQSIDAPARMAMIPEILGAELTPAGISMHQVAGQLAMPVAIMVTGLAIDALGYGGAYLLSGLGFVATAACVYVLKYRSSHNQDHTDKHYGFAETIKDVRYGLGYARRHPVIFWVIMMLILMMSFGYPATASLGPTWVTTVVGVPIPKMGFVMMFWGIGSFVAALLMMQMASFRRRGALIGGGAMLFSISFLIFSSGNSVTNVIIGNFGLGMGMTTTMVSSTILIQHLVPNEVRGRLMSILQLNMAFAQLMTMPVALLAQWLTLPVLFPILSYIALAVVVLILVTQRQVVQAQVHP